MTDKTTKLTDTLKKVAEKKTYAVGDTVDYNGKKYKIVDALDNGDFHLKNLAEPFDSFLALLPKEKNDSNS
jgi:hypothetical protein